MDYSESRPIALQTLFTRATLCQRGTCCHHVSVVRLSVCLSVRHTPVLYLAFPNHVLFKVISYMDLSAM